MPPVRTARDKNLLDALEAARPHAYSGPAWRIVRDGRDPTRCSASGSRWDDASFDVLYTSLRADGAIAEMYFHLSRGQPVMPTLVRYRLFELEIALSSCLRFPTLDDLAALGLKTATFGQMSYKERTQEYPRTQDIAEAAHFLGHDGLIVPSARSEWGNIVVFCDAVDAVAVRVVRDHGLVDWAGVRGAALGY